MHSINMAKLSKKKCCKRDFKTAIPLLNAVCRMSLEERESLLQYLNSKGREILYSCITNCVYNKKVPAEKRKEIRQKLGDKGKVYEYLSCAENKEEKKRKLLKQTGEGLPLILSSVLPILEQVIQ